MKPSLVVDGEHREYHEQSRREGCGGPGGRRTAGSRRSTPLVLADEQAGDEEARDHEEDVDADEAAPDTRASW